MLLNPIEQRSVLNNGTHRVAAKNARHMRTIGIKIASDRTLIAVTLFRFQKSLISRPIEQQVPVSIILPCGEFQE
jgi:hypothetical protein